MASRSDTELLTEHFGYPPVSLLDEIINSVNFLAERALHSIEQGLLGAPPASLGFRPSTSTRGKDHDDGDEGEEEDDPARRHRDEVEAGVHQLETLLWASIDKNFDRFEIYVMRNILCLRPVEMQWMRLGHYEGLDFEQGQGFLDGGDDALGLEDGGEEKEKEKEGEDGGGGGDAGKEGEEKLTVGSVNKLRRRLQASQRLHCMLVAEQARNAALLGEVKRLVGTVSGGAGVKIEPQSSLSAGQAAGQGSDGQQQEKEEEQKPPLRFVHEKGDLTVGDAETPLTTTTAFMLSQMQALRELSTTLRGELPALAAARDEEDADEEQDVDGKKSWRRERLEYVEKATRKHLENVRGLELGKNGEVRDGEWDGGGRSLAKGEVESLEQLVELLDGGNEEQDRMDES